MAAAESRTARKRRMKEVIRRLRQRYPDATTSLRFNNGHELLIGTILSAQCTDSQVNRVTPRLFEKYPTLHDFARADVEELSRDIRSCGYHNQKARAIKGTTLVIEEEYDGRVPDTMEDLLKLPGVGRKTANCVLGTLYGIPSVVVDTHMIRIMGLLGFTESQDPARIEREIMEIAPREDWIDLTHLVIRHGRHICIARRPLCADCPLSDICPSSLV
ncbi:MAG: endonuclease III [Fidelibacterota bacterium]